MCECFSCGKKEPEVKLVDLKKNKMCETCLSLGKGLDSWEEVQIDLTDEVLRTLCLKAIEENVTVNGLIIHILRKTIDKIEKEEQEKNDKTKRVNKKGKKK